MTPSARDGGSLRFAKMPVDDTPMPSHARPDDTSEDAHRVQGEIYAKMGGAARLAAAFALSETVKHLALAGIRHRHPNYTDEQVFHAWTRLKLGDDLVRAVWPSRALVDP
jgi:hypothetical protein